MPALRDLQRDFARSLLDEGELPSVGMAIYRHNVFGVLIGALRLTYPALERLMGAAAFAAAAADFVRRCPPRGACLNDYGAEFGEFLPEESADLARLEWAINEAAKAPDEGALDPTSLVALDAEQEAGLRVRPRASVRLVMLKTRADALRRALLDGKEGAAAEPGPALLLVHRWEDAVLLRSLSAREAAFTEALFAGRPVARLLDSFPDCTTLFAEYLAAGHLGQTP